MDTKLAKVYYSPQDYWKGAPSIKKLAEAAKLLEETAKRWFIYCTSVNFTVVLFPFLSSPRGSVYRFLYSVYQTGSLGDLSPCPELHSSPETRRIDT